MIYYSYVMCIFYVLDMLCLTVVICARILSSGCMSAPENGTIAHNNKQTYIKTKTILLAKRVWQFTTRMCHGFPS